MVCSWLAATDARCLRGALGPFCDLLVLASKVLAAFGPPAAGVAQQQQAVS